MRWRYILLGLLLLCPVSVFAQVVPEAVVSWDVKFFAAGVNPATGTPIQSANVTVAASTCNLPMVPLPTGMVVNPTKIYIADPVNPSRDCQVPPTTSSGLLLSVPLGLGIVATAEARGATLVSARSAASNPFDRVVVPAPPPVATSIRVVP